MIDAAEEHLGAERAGRYLRKFYPHYLDRLGAPRGVADELQRSAGTRPRPGAGPRAGRRAPRASRGGPLSLTERVEAWAAQGRRETFRDHGIHVTARTGEGPLLLLLHGFPTSSYDWRAVLEIESGAGRARLRLPRLRALRQAARSHLRPRLAGRPDRGADRAPRRGRPGVHLRPRHGDLGRDRAVRPRHRRRARLRGDRGAALQRLDDPRARPPHPRPADAAQPARAARRPAHLGALLQGPVRLDLLRPSTR